MYKVYTYSSTLYKQRLSVYRIGSSKIDVSICRYNYMRNILSSVLYRLRGFALAVMIPCSYSAMHFFVFMKFVQFDNEQFNVVQNGIFFFFK